MAIQVKSLTKSMGAEVVGLDLSQPVDDADFTVVKQAWLETGLVLFRRQTGMTPAQHVAFSKRFGELEVYHAKHYTLPEHPEIFVLSNMKKADGRQVGAPPSKVGWHTDSHFLKKPAAASLFHAKIVPDEGGNTMFANMYAAYDALPRRKQEQLAGLKVGASRVRQFASGAFPDRPPLSEAEKAAMPDVEHPLVRTHPETGRKALYLGGGSAWGIVGMPLDEGWALLQELRAFATQPQFVYSHPWEVGDLVIWDNRCTMHSATPFDVAKYDRLMYRTTVAGDVPN